MAGVANKNFDLLGSVETKQTPLMLTLFGFRKTISRHLGLHTLPLIMHDNTRAILRREENPEYPYGYFRMSSFEIDRSGQPNKTIRRHSSTMTLDSLDNATVSKGYLFPAKIMVELHFIHDDPRKILAFIEKATILGAVDGFSFQAGMEGSSDWSVTVAMDEGPVDIPQVELESESEAAAFDVTLRFTISTRAGVVKSVPKINNDGEVTKNVIPEKAPDYE